ncbi:MAG: chromosome segregation protein SMC, partial [Nitrospinae bacterium]|nr:chromosome segregation protein SMC [Nitrospinota bacterium]
MRGFKSFVDETALMFEPGITAIVGPNGCGKSNIADAIRWVLGEQSAKHMRGGKMEDFIFNGSGRRKQAGFAEVSITMVNDDGKITTLPYAEYPEVTVTRKLYRSGESEYYINKVPCRLKDIIDLFLDTGISTRSLSIIEQGQVTAIVNSRPEDRRGLIEEAAGVMKYKSRRNAALNKLAASQQNLLRIQDLLGELERQRNSLSRQAKKAERYMGFRAEIREKAHDWYANEYQLHSVKLTGMEATLSAAREKETAVAAELSARRNRNESLSGAIGLEERALGEKKDERYQIASAIEKNESHIELLTRQLADLARVREEAELDIARLEEEKARIGGDREGRVAEAARLEGAIAEAGARKETLDAESRDVRQRLAGKQDELARLQRESMDLMRRLSESKNRQGQLAARLEMADNRLSGLTGRRDEAAAQVARLEAEVARMTEELATAQASATTERETHQRLTAELEQATERLNEAAAALRAVEDEITRRRSRLDSLKELERNMEGFGEGVRGLMKLASSGKMAAPAGLLADGLRIAPEFETALAAALGERLEAAMIADENGVAEAVRLLREGAVGRAILLAGGMVGAVNEPSAPSHPALVGRASELVTFTDAAPEAARRTLAGIFVARDLAGGMEIWRQNPGAYGVVTLDGDLIDADGFVTGGGKPAGQGAAIVAR